MNKSINGKMLKGRDLITIGILSAIYFVISLVFMVLSGFHPILWMMFPAFVALVAGIPFMLMCAKVQKPGAVFIMSMTTGLLFFLSESNFVILAMYIISGILGEIARSTTKYSSFKGNTISFALFSLGTTGSPLPIWIMRENFLAQITQNGMPADYIATLEALSSPGMLIVTMIAPLIAAVIGSFIAKSMFKKHFMKAGIV